MSEQDPKNLAQSVLDRLRNLSRERSEDFNLLLTRFAGERLLHRISRSEFCDRFVLLIQAPGASWIPGGPWGG